MQVSYFKQKEDQRKQKDVNFWDFITTDHYKETIEAIRSGSKELKGNLSAITPHASFESLRRADFTPSGILFVDVDGKENKHPPSGIKRMFAGIEHTLAVRYSASGNGVHAFINIGDNDLEKCYLSMKKITLDTGVIIDKCKDYQRLCFASYDKDVYINKQATVFHPFKDDVLFPKREPRVIKHLSSDQEFDFSSYCKKFDGDYVQGNRDNWVHHKAFKAAEKGVSKQMAEMVLMQYAEPGMSEQTILNKINRLYK